jgi:DNA end-binding protein Ku
MGTPRAIWSGTVNFGLVSVPVKLHAATEEHEGVQFHQVRRSDGSRITYKRVAVADGEEVPYSEIAKGLVWGGEVLVFSDEDLASLPVPTARAVEVQHFCKLEQVNTMLYAKSYFVTPANQGANAAYRLLAEAMAQLDVVAVAKVALRQRESLCVLRPWEDGVHQVLILELLRFPEEIRSYPDIELPDPDPKALGLAMGLVKSMTAKFQPQEHVDGYRKAVLARAELLASGVKPEAVPAGEEATPVMDLFAQLAASVEAAKKAQAVS